MHLPYSQLISWLSFVILVFISLSPLVEAKCSRLPSGRCWVNCREKVFDIICNDVTSDMVQSDIRVFEHTAQELRLYIWSSPSIRRLSADVFSSVASQILLVDLQDVVELDAFPEVQNLVNLRRLNIWNSPLLCGLSFELLPKSIWKLAFNKICVKYIENDFFEVPALPNLEIFTLRNLTIKGWDPQFLSIFPNLKELEISNSTFDFTNERTLPDLFPQIKSSLVSVKLLNNNFFSASEKKSRRFLDRLFKQIKLSPGAVVDFSFSNLTFNNENVDGLQNFQLAKSLNFRGNSFADVSSRNKESLFGKFNLLEQLDLGQSNLVPVPGMFSELANLNVLKLDRNQLRGLDRIDIWEGSYATNLSHLDLSSNDLTTLPSNNTLIELAPQIKHFDLKNNRLEIFLSSNLTDESPLLQAFFNLETLILSHNNFTKFYGNHLKFMKNLENLDLSCNPFDRIQKEMFFEFPEKISRLNLSICIQNPTPAPFVEMDAFSALPAIKVLSLSSSSYRKWIFLALQNLSQAARQSLEELYLDDNEISYIKEDTITVLPNLQLLSVNRNSLQSIAPGIFASLPELRSLRLNGNKISTLSVKAFSSLKNQLQKLNHLDVSGNRLAGIAAGTFDELPRLNSLMLGWNNVEVQNIFRNGGKELTYLGIQNYNRSCLKPEFFEQLPKLRWVLPDEYNLVLANPDIPLPQDNKPLLSVLKVCVMGLNIPDHETYPGLRDFVSVTIHDSDEGTGVQYPIIAAFFPLQYCPVDDYVNKLKNILCSKQEKKMQG